MYNEGNQYHNVGEDKNESCCTGRNRKHQRKHCSFASWTRSFGRFWVGSGKLADEWAVDWGRFGMRTIMEVINKRKAPSTFNHGWRCFPFCSAYFVGSSDSFSSSLSSNSSSIGILLHLLYLLNYLQMMTKARAFWQLPGICEKIIYITSSNTAFSSDIRSFIRRKNITWCRFIQYIEQYYFFYSASLIYPISNSTSAEQTHCENPAYAYLARAFFVTPMTTIVNAMAAIT